MSSPAASVINAEYSFSSPRQQLFAFPPDVIRSMLEKPSSHKGLSKLYQTCKYFYAKRPIIIADSVRFGMVNDDEYGNGHPSITLWPSKNLDISRLQIPIWLTDWVSFDRYDFNEQQIPSCFRYSVNEIALCDCSLKFEDFLTLTSEKMVSIISNHGYGRVYYNDDMSKAASLAEILQHAPNIRVFNYCIDEHCSAETLKELDKVKLNNKFEVFRLRIEDVHPTFDFNLICEYIKKNCTDDTHVDLWFLERNVREKLLLALEKLDPKWKNEAHEKLKELFDHAENWIDIWEYSDEEMDE